MNTGLSRYCDKGIPVPRVLCQSYRREVPGKGMGILQKLQKFRVRVRKCYRTHRSSGYCGTGVENLQKFRAGIKMLYPYPGYLWHGRTEPTQVPSTGMNVEQNLQKFRVRVWMSYRTYSSSLQGNSRGKHPGYGSVRALQNTTSQASINWISITKTNRWVEQKRIGVLVNAFSVNN